MPFTFVDWSKNYINYRRIFSRGQIFYDKHTSHTPSRGENDPSYLKMLIQAVGVPILELDGALAPRGGLRLLHPWNTDSRTFGHAAAEAVPESRQHSSRDSTLYILRFRFARAERENDFRIRDARLFLLPRGAAPSRKWRLSRRMYYRDRYTYP